MNNNYEEGRELIKKVREMLQPSQVLVILGTPYIHLMSAQSMTTDMSNLKLAAQNCHQEVSGAYTGEISAAMIKSVGADYVILGHSERREYFGEDDALIAKKIDTALANGLRPIYCCGEKLEVRESKKHVALVSSQLEAALFHLSPEQFKEIIIAYEPVWAIGTGLTASPEQAQEMHLAIRKKIGKKFGADLADGTTILYGGSCKPNNANTLFSQPDVDGGLIGGASLKADDFVAIVNSF